MLKMGSTAKGRRWIRFCISTVRSLVLVNGKLCGFFDSLKEVRQGDLLSAMLFIRLMKALCRMVNSVMAGGYMMGFSATVGEQGIIRVSHLLFVGDTLIFCNTERAHSDYLRQV